MNRKKQPNSLPIELINDEKDWSEGSDDEITLAKLSLSPSSSLSSTSPNPPSIPPGPTGPGVHSRSSLSQPPSTSSGIGSSSNKLRSSISSSSSSSNSNHPPSGSSSATPLATGGSGGSGWSFNPFSLISPKSPSSSNPITPNNEVESTPLPTPSSSSAASTTRKPSTPSSSSTRESQKKGKGVEVLQEEEEEQGEKEEESEEIKLKLMKEALKVDYEELVRDPLSHLTHLQHPSSSLPLPSADSSPGAAKPPTTTTTSSSNTGNSSNSNSKTRRTSLSSPGSKQKSTFPSSSTFSSPFSPSQQDSDPSDNESGSEDDGYIQLGALNSSSLRPEIVEFLNQDQEELIQEEEKGEKGRERRRRERFLECLKVGKVGIGGIGGERGDVDLAELRKLSWAGIPNDLRPIVWQLLLGYLPAPSSRRLSTLARKRQEYSDAVRLAFSRHVPTGGTGGERGGGGGSEGLDGPIWHQICIDVPRTNVGVRLWRGEVTQRSLERILYVWAIRHPASGYVQGINDLVTPFFQVFLSFYITTNPESYDPSLLPLSVLEAIEADSFWCLSKLLDGIQDNYIFAQPGIQRQVGRMRELCGRVDAPLAAHLEENNVEFIQFAFRWMNCLLMRELNVKNIVRMWDTYLAEGADAFSEFHLYVCLAFLVKWSEQLRGMDFQSIIMFLQSLPTQNWTDQNTELLLSEAFMWSRTFEAR